MNKISAIILILITASTARSATVSQTKPITSIQLSSLSQAIDDEIYDYRDSDYYFPEGGPVGNFVSNNVTRVNMYVDPIISNGFGVVIYKLMPYGELIRIFNIRDNGVIVLDGDPALGFPASQKSRKTVYLKDGVVCTKEHTWIKSYFDVKLSPSAERIREAVARQKSRVGFSKWEYDQSKLVLKK